ncbi:MAG: hypothetical protein HFE75_03160 [Firmicutes bacterium]|nr:hypothetical protein [Bacillota bacterium]
MGILEDFEKDKIWNRMLDYQILGMTRQDLDQDNGIAETLTKNNRL